MPIVHAPCGHVTCASCSLRWLQKKTNRSCALCRAPVLSVAQCPLLGQLLESRAAPADPEDASTPADSTKEDAETIADFKRQLQELNQGDLNHMPADYRAHIVRQATSRAIRKCDLPMLEACLKSYKSRASTLMLSDLAALWKKEPVKPALELLLEHGARLDGHCADRPLHHAVYTGNLPMVEALLEKKADPTKPTLDGSTPLHIAVRRGRQDATSLLLEHMKQPIDDFPGLLDLAEKGLDFHESHCEFGQHMPNSLPCERCDARKKIQNDLLERQKRDDKKKKCRKSAGASSSTDARQREILNDAESDDSSSFAGTSESDVSDLESEDLDDSGAEEGEEEEAEEDFEEMDRNMAEGFMRQLRRERGWGVLHGVAASEEDEDSEADYHSEGASYRSRR